jgi:integrase
LSGASEGRTFGASGGERAAEEYIAASFLGTADDLKSIASARKAVVGLRREINLNDVRTRREAITLADLSRHFQQRELVRGNTRIAYSTRKAYEGYLRKWIEPRWGEYRLFEIRAVEVESWLKSLNRAKGTRCKMRNVMSLLFNHGRRHDLCDRNPIQWVRQGAKRRTAPDVLTSDEVQGLLANLRFLENEPWSCWPSLPACGGASCSR